MKNGPLGSWSNAKPKNRSCAEAFNTTAGTKLDFFIAALFEFHEFGVFSSSLGGIERSFPIGGYGFIKKGLVF